METEVGVLLLIIFGVFLSRIARFVGSTFNISEIFIEVKKLLRFILMD